MRIIKSDLTYCVAYDYARRYDCMFMRLDGDRHRLYIVHSDGLNCSELYETSKGHFVRKHPVLTNQDLCDKSWCVVDNLLREYQDNNREIFNLVYPKECGKVKQKLVKHSFAGAKYLCKKEDKVMYFRGKSRNVIMVYDKMSNSYKRFTNARGLQSYHALEDELTTPDWVEVTRSDLTKEEIMSKHCNLLLKFNRVNV